MITNTYHYAEDFAQSNLPKLASSQIALIEDICRDADRRGAKDTEPFAAPYGISNVLQNTQVYLASKKIRDRMFTNAKDFEAEMRKQLEDRLKEISSGLCRNVLTPLLDDICKTSKPLGWFEPRKNEVFICYEAIIEKSKDCGLSIDSLLVAVTIHELAHAMMCGVPQKEKDFRGYWLEESLANKVMLNCTEHWSAGRGDIETFVKSQPMAYSAGWILYESRSSNFSVLKHYKKHINTIFCDIWIMYLVEILTGMVAKVDKTRLDRLFALSFDAPKRIGSQSRYPKPTIPKSVSFEKTLDKYQSIVSGLPSKSIMFCKIQKSLASTGNNLSIANVYKCAKGDWPTRQTPKYVVALYKSVVVGVYVVDQWSKVLSASRLTKQEFTPKRLKQMKPDERDIYTILSTMKLLELTDDFLRKCPKSIILY